MVPFPKGLPYSPAVEPASSSKNAHVFTCHLDMVTRGAGGSAPSVTEYCYDVKDNLEKVWDPNHPRASNPRTG